VGYISGSSKGETCATAAVKDDNDSKVRGPGLSENPNTPVKVIITLFYKKRNKGIIKENSKKILCEIRDFSFVYGMWLLRLIKNSFRLVFCAVFTHLKP